MRKWLAIFAVVVVALPVFAQETVGGTAESNPFFVEWTTPFGVPPFAEIKEEHFLPAFEKGIAECRAEVAAITGSSDPATFANTVEALDASGRLLEKVGSVFFNLSSAETNDELQAIAKQVAPKLSALRDDIAMDPALFARVKAVWEKRGELELNPEQRRLVEETYKDFVRGGANLSEEQKSRLREINSELSLLGLQFGENLLKATNGYRLVVERREDLAGLPGGVVSAASEAAKKAGLEGKWVFTLHAPSIWPFLQYADNRELRKQILEAYTSRCDGGELDNTSNLVRQAGLRAAKAKLLGADTWADFVLSENMAKNPAGVYGLLDRLWQPALDVARNEAAALQAMGAEASPGFKLEPWDWRYYAEKVKKARYDFDEEAVRPYFKLENVRSGAFYVANRLYGLTFTERSDIPVYHPDVRAFEVNDADGSHLGVLMLDYFPRPGKRGGAWSSRYRGQWISDGKDVRPVVVNVGNFTRPTGDTPALLSLDEAETLFHEFGHGLHSLLSRIHYRSLARVPRDFVELPSQIMENWMLEPEVLAVYAKHWKTGEVMPAELVEKIEKAGTFNQGFASVEYLAASYLDMRWHTLKGVKAVDSNTFEKAALAKIGLIPEIVSRYRSPYFAHIFGGGGGYSAGYYSYIWSEVLDSDAFQAFKDKGLFDAATASSFRKNILERGGTREAGAMWLAFRGREPSVEPLLIKRGLEPEPAAAETGEAAGR